MRPLRWVFVIFAVCFVALVVILSSAGGNGHSNPPGFDDASPKTMFRMKQQRPLSTIGLEKPNIDDFCPLEEVEDDEVWFRGVNDTFAAYQPCRLPRFSQRDGLGRIVFSCPGETYLLNPDGSQFFANTNEPVDISGQEFIRAYCDWPGLGLVMKPYYNLLPKTARWDRDQILAGLEKRRVSRSALDVNVYLVMLDAVSSEHFDRTSHETIRAMETAQRSGTAQVFAFDRFHVVGWHSVQNQLPMLVGHDCGGKHHGRFYNHTRLSERIRPESVLTKFWQRYGYVTAGLSEDCNEGAKVGPVNVRG